MHVLCIYSHIQVIKYDNVINNCEPIYTIQVFKHGHKTCFCLSSPTLPWFSFYLPQDVPSTTSTLNLIYHCLDYFLQFKHMFLGMPKYWMLQFFLFLNITLNISLWTSSYEIYSFPPCITSLKFTLVIVYSCNSVIYISLNNKFIIDLFILLSKGKCYFQFVVVILNIFYISWQTYVQEFLWYTYVGLGSLMVVLLTFGTR